MDFPAKSSTREIGSFLGLAAGELSVFFEQADVKDKAMADKNMNPIFFINFLRHEKC